MNPVELRTVTRSSLLGETPEGQFRLDRLERRAEAERRELERLVPGEVLDRLERAVDAAVIGDPSDAAGTLPGS